MAGEFLANNVISGTFGDVWVNGERYLEVKSFEAKVTGEFADIISAGKLTTGKKYLGYTAEGTITCSKIDSKVMSLLHENYKNGTMPTISIISKLDDPEAFGAERIEMLNVTFTEFMLANFTVKEVTDVEIPFAFEDYNVLDLIN